MIKSLILTEENTLKPWVAYALVAAVVATGAYFVYAAWTGGPDAPLEHTLMCATPGCGYTEHRELRVGEILPGKCPKCGKNSVYCAFNCPKCKTPNLMNEDLGKPGRTKCSKCGTEIIHGG